MCFWYYFHWNFDLFGCPLCSDSFSENIGSIGKTGSSEKIGFNLEEKLAQGAKLDLDKK